MEGEESDRCQICGTTTLEGKGLLNWRYYNYQDKMVCFNCTEDDMDATYRKIGYSEKEIKELRKTRNSY
jgi:hypothetical protein